MRLTSNRVDPVAKVVIGTVQRLYSMLKGEDEMTEDADELSAGELTGGLDSLRREPLPVVYRPALPIETFDVVFVDEAHRSIYTLWRQVGAWGCCAIDGDKLPGVRQFLLEFHKRIRCSID